MKLDHPSLRRLIALISGHNRTKNLAVLTHLFFTPGTARPANVIVTASDLDYDFFWTLPGSLDRPASCPLDWFVKIARSVKSGGHLEVRLDDRGLSLWPSSGPSARSPERSLPIAEAPAFSTAGFTRGGWLSHATLTALSSITGFISTDETRYVLNGVLVTTTGHIVATDGRRLLHRATPGTVLPEDIILPPTCLSALTPLADDRQGTGRLAAWIRDDNDILLLQSGSCFVRQKLINGHYPNWRQVVPTDFNSIVDLDESFLETLAATLQRSPDRKNTTVRLSLHPDGSVESAIHSGKSELLDPFRAGRHLSGSGVAFTTAVNANYLQTALTITGRRLRLQNEISPLLVGDPLTGEAVIMPMRLNA